MADKEKKYSDIDLSKYASGFQGSDALTQAGTLKQNAVDAYQNFANAGFSSQKQGMADSILNQYLNRDKFSYDFNADALYQQYKDKYIQQGKMAMQDTMGQAAAMTGGYGNSYAASVGNQAYQAHLQNLNDVIPELYQMAYDKYNQEGQDMLNKYSLLGNAIDREYGMWNDTLGRLMADRDYYGQEESNLYNREYGAWNDNRNYDTTQYWNETNFGYGKEQDAITNAFREREMAIAEKEFALKEALEADGYVWNPKTGKYEKEPVTPQPSNYEIAEDTINDTVRDGAVATGKVDASGKPIVKHADKGTASGQAALRGSIGNTIRGALKAGDITSQEAAKLQKELNPRGYTK